MQGKGVLETFWLIDRSNPAAAVPDIALDIASVAVDIESTAPADKDIKLEAAKEDFKPETVDKDVESKSVDIERNIISTPVEKDSKQGSADKDIEPEPEDTDIRPVSDRSSGSEMYTDANEEV